MSRAAVRWPGPLWRGIEAAGEFWMREADVRFRAGDEIDLRDPPGRFVRTLRVVAVDGPFVEAGTEAPRYLRVRFAS